MRLIHDGQLRLEQVDDHTEDELRGLLDQCGQSTPAGTTKVGDEQSVFIAITSKQDDHKTRQGHKCSCGVDSVQVSCDESQSPYPRPRGPISTQYEAVFVSSTRFSSPSLWESFYTGVVSVSLHVRANCWPLSSPCTRECTAASARRHRPRLTTQLASCPNSARTR